MTVTQAPTPGPLSVGQEETIAFNLCAVHGFAPDFVKTQRDFALAVIREYEVVCRPRLAPTAPVEASGSELADAIERVDRWANYPYTYADMVAVDSPLSTFTAGDLRLILAALRPQPSGETREALDRLKMAAHVYEDDEMAADCETLEALLSARPLALGGQQGEDAPELAFEYARDFGVGFIVDGKAVRPDRVTVCHGEKSWLRQDTTPARAEAQDEGAAGGIEPCSFCGADPGVSKYQVDDETTKWSAGCDGSGAPESWGYVEHYVSVHADTKEGAIAAWNRRAHPSPTPAADADRVRIAVEALEPFARLQLPKRSVGNAGAYSLLHTDIRRAAEALAALKSEGK